MGTFCCNPWVRDPKIAAKNDLLISSIVQPGQEYLDESCKVKESFQFNMFSD